jgi:hypothetical protein
MQQNVPYPFRNAAVHGVSYMVLDAARDGDLDELQRLIGEGASVHEVDSDGENALMQAVLHAHAPVAHWLLKEGGARISDTTQEGRTVFLFALEFAHCSLVQWLLEEGGANITDTAVMNGKHKSVWDLYNFNELGYGLKSLVKVMVLLDDASNDFIAKLSPQNADVVTQGRQIRALRPSYLEQQHALIDTHCPLPTVLQSIVATYAEPTSEDMWTDWVQWM